MEKFLGLFAVLSARRVCLTAVMVVAIISIIWGGVESSLFGGCPYQGCIQGDTVSCAIYSTSACGGNNGIVCVKEGCNPPFYLLPPDYGYYCIDINFACTGYPYNCCLPW